MIKVNCDKAFTSSLEIFLKPFVVLEGILKDYLDSN